MFYGYIMNGQYQITPMNKARTHYGA